MIDLAALEGRRDDALAAALLRDVLAHDPAAATAALRLATGVADAAAGAPTGAVTVGADEAGESEAADLLLSGPDAACLLVVRVRSEGLDEVAAAVGRLAARGEKTRAYTVLAPAAAAHDYRDLAHDRFDRQARGAARDALEQGAVTIRTLSWEELLDALASCEGSDAATAGLAASLAAFVDERGRGSGFEFDAGTGIAFGETSLLEAMVEAQGRDASAFAAWALERARSRGLRLEWRRFAPRNACLRLGGRIDGARWRAVTIYLDGRIVVRLPGAAGPEERELVCTLKDAIARPELYRHLLGLAIDHAAGKAEALDETPSTAPGLGGGDKAPPC